MGRLSELKLMLDDKHEECPDKEGGCWCCCIICTENPDTMHLQHEYWLIVQEREARSL